MANNKPLNITYGVANNFTEYSTQQLPTLLPKLTRSHTSTNTVTHRNYSPTRGRANIIHARSTSPLPSRFEIHGQTMAPLNAAAKGRASLTHVKGINRSSGSRALIKTRKHRRHRSRRSGRAKN